MKCEDCLPLIEEYFDGEVDRRTGELVGAHLSACADCAAALDALAFEQEIYARYDRGVEVSPALWQAVRAEIARDEPAAQAAKPLPPVSRLREQFVAALGALSLRPAFASSLALLVVGVTAGTLWFSSIRHHEPADQVVVHMPNRSEVKGSSPGKVETATPSPLPPVKEMKQAGDEPAPPSVHGASSPAAPQAVRNVRDSGVLMNAGERGGAGDTVVFDDDHPVMSEDPLLAAQPARVETDDVMLPARLLDPEEKEIARHVEQAQMLLRSFRNARPPEGEGTVNVAYEKSMSRKLLDENLTLMLEAETSGDKTTQQVLDTLEPFLLDIANLRDKPSRAEVRSIKERMRKTEIIAALQVY